MVQVAETVTVQEALVEERVAAFDGQRCRVLARDHAEVGLIELAVDGPQPTEQRYFIGRPVYNVPLTVRRRFIVKTVDGAAETGKHQKQRPDETTHFN